jgi:hypothetical protein
MLTKQIAGKLRMEQCHDPNLADNFYNNGRYVDDRQPWFNASRFQTHLVEISRFNHKLKKWVRKGPGMMVIVEDGSGYRLLAHYLHGTCVAAFNIRGLSHSNYP